MSSTQRIVHHFRRFMTLLVCLAPVSFSHGSTAQKLSFDRLIGEADVIVRGKVEEVKTRQAPDRALMSTVVSVSVEQQFKGPKTSAVTIEQPGGSAGDVSLGVAGLPEFTSGDDVILFLKRHHGGGFDVVGGKQGKFAVKTRSGSNNVVEDYARRAEALDRFIDRLTNNVKGAR